MMIRWPLTITTALLVGSATTAYAAPVPIPPMPQTPPGAGDNPFYGEARYYRGAGEMLGAGFGSTAITSGDFDGDGSRDLAVVDPQAGAVSVLRNLGDGGFDSPTSYSTGDFAAAVVAVDVDGSGGTDLAVVNAMAGTLTVLLNAGDGTFSTGVDYPVGQSAFDVTAADFDGDGKPDLAVATPFMRQVTVLRNVGGSQFERAGAVNVGEGPTNLLPGDFDQDGVTDLAVAVSGGFDPLQPGAARIHILLGNGDGTFEKGGSSGIPGFLEGFAAGDVNGDGVLDVVGADAYNQVLSVLLGNGDGTLQAPIQSLAGNGLVDVALADVNGDCILDAVVGDSSPNEMAVLLGQGDGTFAMTESHPIASAPQSVIVDDFGGNGSPDVAFAGQTRDISVLLRQAMESANDLDIRL